MEDSLFSSLASPVFLLTARADLNQSGMIVTWLTPASLAPKATRVVVALSPQNFTTVLARASGRFVLHLLSAGQAALIERFGLRSGRECDKFAGLGHASSASGIPVLPGTCGWHECAFAAEIDCGDRIVAIAHVVQRGADSRLPALCIPEAFAQLPEATGRLLAQRWQTDLARDAELSRDALNFRLTAPAGAAS